LSPAWECRGKDVGSPAAERCRVRYRKPGIDQYNGGLLFTGMRKRKPISTAFWREDPTEISFASFKATTLLNLSWTGIPSVGKASQLKIYALRVKTGLLRARGGVRDSKPRDRLICRLENVLTPTSNQPGTPPKIMKMKNREASRVLFHKKSSSLRGLTVSSILLLPPDLKFLQLHRRRERRAVGSREKVGRLPVGGGGDSDGLLSDKRPS